MAQSLYTPLMPFAMYTLQQVTYSLNYCEQASVSQSVQSLSHVQLFATPWIAACQASLSMTNSRSSLRLMFIESVMPSSHLILCCPLLLLPPIRPSISLFQWVNSSHEVDKVLEFQFSISASKEIPGLISFRMDWLDLLAVQGTLMSSATPQFKSIYSSTFSCLYSPTLKTIHDHWKNHSLDYTELYWQSNVSAF